MTGPTRAGPGLRAPRAPRTVAIDGPAGSGKSTVARLLAERLGAERLDTGAMYRAVAWSALHGGIDLADADAVAALAADLAVDVGPVVVTVDGTDVTEAIRTPEIDAAVSVVAANPAVRRHLVDRQRRWAAARPVVVVEGRDIGTVVLPDADLKVYLTASVAERARRRATERGDGDGAALAAVAAQLARRDALDSSRADSPLPRPEDVAGDAMLVDTTDLAPAAIVDAVLARWEAANGSDDDAAGGGPMDDDADRRAAATSPNRPPTSDAADPAPAAAVTTPAGAPDPAPATAVTTPAGAPDPAPAAAVTTPAGGPIPEAAGGHVGRGMTPRAMPAAGPASSGIGVSEGTYRFLRRLAHLINRTYWRVTVDGAEHVPADGPVILAPVHRSFVDFFVVSEATPRKVFYMTKEEMWKSPRLGSVIASLGGFPVNRSGADREALVRAQAVLERGDVLILFPEGTRRRGTAVADILEGATFLAARTGAVVVPIGIGGSDRVMPLGSRVPRPARVHLVVGPPMAPPARSAGGRVPRSQVRAMTDQLRAELQRCYDQARAAVG